MNEAEVIGIFEDTLFTILWISLPMLIVGMVVGILVAIFEAVTSIREMTLTFVPKILAVGAVTILCFPWMVAKLTDFTYRIFSLIETGIP
jgi:flagellar biosynthesis protein FliQ